MSMPSPPEPILSRAAHWVKALTRSGSSSVGPMETARRHLLEGHPRRAMSAYHQALKVSGNDPRALEGIGWCLLDLEEPLAAEPWFHQALAADPGSVSAVRGLEAIQQDRYKPLSEAWKDYHAGDVEEALEKFQAGAGVGADLDCGERWRYLIGIAWCYYGLRQHAQAFEYFQRVHERMPDQVPAREAMGFCCFFLQRYDDAREILSGVVADSPDRRDAHSFLGWTALEVDQDTEALAHFDRACALDTSCGDPVFGRGWSLFRLGRVAEATTAFESAGSLDPFHVSIVGLHEQVLERDELPTELLDGIAWSRYRHGGAEQALELFESLIARGHVSMPIVIGQAACLIRMRRYSEGAELLQKIDGLEQLDFEVVEGEHYPEDRLINSPWSLLAWCHYHAGRHSEALSIFEACLGRDPERINLLSGLGWSHLALGQLEQGARAFIQANAIDSGYIQAVRGNGSARRRLAERDAPAFAALRQGHFSQASELLEDALNHEPYPDRRERLERALRWSRERASSPCPTQP